nr:alpha/beta hydrolase [Lentibacter algarum]
MAYIEDGESYPAKWVSEAQKFRDAMRGDGRAQLDVSYGSAPRQKFDVFLPSGDPKGLMVFVHGGFWHMLGKEDWSHMAKGAVAKGWAVCVPSYTLCPEARIAEITGEITQAVCLAAGTVAGPIALTGHSAGGHLVSRMLEVGRLPEAVASRLQHVVPISPVADLRPMLKTSMNADFKLDMALAEAESPVLMRDRVACPVTVWIGGAERPAFIEQARSLWEAWNVPHVIDPPRHHYDVVEPLCDADSEMLSVLLG